MASLVVSVHLGNLRVVCVSQRDVWRHGKLLSWFPFGASSASVCSDIRLVPQTCAHTHTHTRMQIHAVRKPPWWRCLFELFKKGNIRSTRRNWGRHLQEVQCYRRAKPTRIAVSRWRAIPSETEERKAETVIKNSHRRNPNHRADETNASQNGP